MAQHEELAVRLLHRHNDTWRRVNAVFESELLGSGPVHISESVQSSLPLGTVYSRELIPGEKDKAER